jgi:hypothetical protein
MRTPEQITADSQLERSIGDVMRAYELMPEDGVIGDWVVAIEVVLFAEESRGQTKYCYLTPGDGVPSHRLYGLLNVTMDTLKQESDS